MDEQPTKRPSVFGDLVLCIPMAPVSQQATRENKDVLTAKIKEITRGYEFLFSDEVHIDIEWMIRESVRWESGGSADVDNILKPLIDALCGPEGLLINDCQIQSLSCRWLDWMKEEEQFTIRFKFMADDWIRKEGLVFVEMKPALYFPFHLDIHLRHLNEMFDSIEKMVTLSDEIFESTGDYQQSRSVLSVQRMFHRSRIVGFKLMDKPQFLSLLRQKTNASQ